MREIREIIGHLASQERRNLLFRKMLQNYKGPFFYHLLVTEIHIPTELKELKPVWQLRRTSQAGFHALD